MIIGRSKLNVGNIWQKDTRSTVQYSTAQYKAMALPQNTTLVQNTTSLR